MAGSRLQITRIELRQASPLRLNKTTTITTTLTLFRIGTLLVQVGIGITITTIITQFLLLTIISPITSLHKVILICQSGTHSMWTLKSCRYSQLGTTSSKKQDLLKMWKRVRMYRRKWCSKVLELISLSSCQVLSRCSECLT